LLSRNNSSKSRFGGGVAQRTVAYRLAAVLQATTVGWICRQQLVLYRGVVSCSSRFLPDVPRQFIGREGLYSRRRCSDRKRIKANKVSQNECDDVQEKD
jgi:hypothetical protein